MRRPDIRLLYASMGNVPCEEALADGIPVGWVHRAKQAMWGARGSPKQPWRYGFASRREAVRHLVRMAKAVGPGGNPRVTKAVLETVET